MLNLKKIKYFQIFKFLFVLAIIIVIYFVFVFILRKLGLPKPEVVISWATTYYEKYGYWVVLIGALAEGTLFINWYLPGSIVVALGATLARHSGMNIFLVLLMVIIGFYFTAIINYFLGRFGWYHVLMKFGLKKPLLEAQNKIQDKGLPILFTAYVHPNFGAVASTAIGLLRFNFFKFAGYAFISILLWNSLWTVLFYLVGMVLLKHVYLVSIAGLVFIYFMFVKSFKKPNPDSHVNLP